MAAKARFDIPTQLPVAVARPIYAGVGVTDRVVRIVRDAVTDVQKRAVAVQQGEAKNVPDRLQQLVDGQVATAGETYAELVRRGETLIGRIRRQQSVRETTASAQTTVAKARTTRTQGTAAAKKSASTAKKTARKSPAKSSAKATATSAKKTATGAAQATSDAAAKVGD